MRAKLLSKVKGTNQVKISHLTKRVICSLFLDFLKKENFQYTPTVFVPECGASDKMLSPGEIKEILHLNDMDEENLLEQILEKIKKVYARKDISETYVQTEESLATGLEKRLKELDAEFLSKTRGGTENIEEKMIKYKRECDEKMRFEVNSEILRIREVEVSAMRIEEAGKYRALLQKMRTEQEEYWKSQLDALKEREKDSRERLTLREKDLEVRENRQKQQFQKELEILKTKENDMKRSVEIELEGARLQRTSWEQKKIEVETKLKEMENFKVSMSTKALDDFNHYKRQFEGNFDEEKRRVYNEKHELQALRDSLSQELGKMKTTEESLKNHKIELMDSNKKLEFYKEEYEKASKEISRNREELRLISETSRRDLDMLTFKDQELTAVKNECKAYKDLYMEQKETLKKYEAGRDIMFQKLSGEEKPVISESEFLSERKNVWKKLEKESLDIKKNMIEVFNTNPAPEYFRASYRPKSYGVVEGKYRTDMRPEPEQKYKTQKVKEKSMENMYSGDSGSEKNSPMAYQNFEEGSGSEKQSLSEKFEETTAFQEKVIKPMVKVAKPMEKEIKPMEKVIKPMEKVIKPMEKVINPIEKVIKPMEKVIKSTQIEYSEESSHDAPSESIESSSNDTFF